MLSKDLLGVVELAAGEGAESLDDEGRLRLRNIERSPLHDGRLAGLAFAETAGERVDLLSRLIELLVGRPNRACFLDILVGGFEAGPPFPVASDCGLEENAPALAGNDDGLEEVALVLAAPTPGLGEVGGLCLVGPDGALAEGALVPAAPPNGFLFLTGPSPLAEPPSVLLTIFLPGPFLPGFPYAHDDVENPLSCGLMQVSNSLFRVCHILGIGITPPPIGRFLVEVKPRPWTIRPSCPSGLV